MMGKGKEEEEEDYIVGLPRVKDESQSCDFWTRPKLSPVPLL